MESLKKLEKNSREQLEEIVAGIGFLEPSNPNLLPITNRFQPLEPRPCVKIMAKIFTCMKDKELKSACEREGSGTGVSKETYRCRVLINCLLWLIAELFEPAEEVYNTFRKLRPNLEDSEKEFKGLQWLIDGVYRTDILDANEEPNERECDHINNMWDWFCSCQEPIIKFIFDISRLHILAPGNLWNIRNHRMYEECMGEEHVREDWSDVLRSPS